MENKLEVNKNMMAQLGSKESHNMIRVIKGSLFAIVISLVLLFIYANVLTFTNISEQTMTPVVITISGISILIGSSVASLKIKKQGLLNGALVGLIYMIFIYILSSVLLTGFIIDAKSVMMIAIGVVAGMIGGIIGVNL